MNDEGETCDVDTSYCEATKCYKGPICSHTDGYDANFHTGDSAVCECPRTRDQVKDTCDDHTLEYMFTTVGPNLGLGPYEDVQEAIEAATRTDVGYLFANLVKEGETRYYLSVQNTTLPVRQVGDDAGDDAGYDVYKLAQNYSICYGSD